MGVWTRTTSIGQSIIIQTLPWLNFFGGNLHFWNRYEFCLHVAALLSVLHVHWFLSWKWFKLYSALSMNCSFIEWIKLIINCDSYSPKVLGSTFQRLCLWGCWGKESAVGFLGCFRLPSPCRCGLCLAETRQSAPSSCMVPQSDKRACLRSGGGKKKKVNWDIYAEKNKTKQETQQTRRLLCLGSLSWCMMTQFGPVFSCQTDGLTFDTRIIWSNEEFMVISVTTRSSNNQPNISKLKAAGSFRWTSTNLSQSVMLVLD